MQKSLHTEQLDRLQSAQLDGLTRAPVLEILRQDAANALLANRKNFANQPRPLPPRREQPLRQVQPPRLLRGGGHARDGAARLGLLDRLVDRDQEVDDPHAAGILPQPKDASRYQ